MENGVYITIAVLASIPVLIGIPYAVYRWVMDRTYYKITGGKVNTPKTILQKITAEVIRENRYALLGCQLSASRLSEMDTQITQHLQWLAHQAY